jgi:hypothetical protein
MTLTFSLDSDTLPVELENETVDVSVGPALQCSAVLSVLTHYIIAVRQHHYVGGTG